MPENTPIKTPYSINAIKHDAKGNFHELIKYSTDKFTDEEIKQLTYGAPVDVSEQNLPHNTEVLATLTNTLTGNKKEFVLKYNRVKMIRSPLAVSLDLFPRIYNSREVILEPFTAYRGAEITVSDVSFIFTRDVAPAGEVKELRFDDLTKEENKEKLYQHSKVIRLFDKFKITPNTAYGHLLYNQDGNVFVNSGNMGFFMAGSFDTVATDHLSYTKAPDLELSALENFKAALKVSVGSFPILPNAISAFENITTIGTVESGRFSQPGGHQYRNTRTLVTYRENGFLIKDYILWDRMPLSNLTYNKETSTNDDFFKTNIPESIHSAGYSSLHDFATKVLGSLLVINKTDNGQATNENMEITFEGITTVEQLKTAIAEGQLIKIMAAPDSLIYSGSVSVKFEIPATVLELSGFKPNYIHMDMLAPIENGSTAVYAKDISNGQRKHGIFAVVHSGNLQISPVLANFPAGSVLWSVEVPSLTRVVSGSETPTVEGLNVYMEGNEISVSVNNTTDTVLLKAVHRDPENNVTGTYQFNVRTGDFVNP